MPRIQPLQTLMVYDGADLSVIEGANYGDTLSFADELMLDDVYILSDTGRPDRLGLGSVDDKKHFVITAETALGTPGASLYLDCALTFMAPDGRTFEVLVFVEVEDGNVANVFFHPLALINSGEPYRLVGLDMDTANARMAEVACVSFTKGTRITLSSGAQVAIEDLKPGDRVLTRNDGSQQVQWIGQSTVRAVGDFAPVVISKGTLNNENDLILSPDHRLFIYQRSDTTGAGRSEVLVKARHLIDGVQVTQIKGGFVDYFQILFEAHHIIYAEGIAAESLLIDGRNLAAIPDDVERLVPRHTPSRHQDMELKDAHLQGGLAARLKAASSR